MTWDMTVGEIIQVITTVGGVFAVVVAIRSELKWLREMIERHEDDDNRRFEELKEDISKSTNFRRRYFDDGR